MASSSPESDGVRAPAASAADSADQPAHRGREELNSLRELLVGNEQRQLAQIAQQIAGLRFDVTAEDVSEVLPTAFALRGAEDATLVKAVLPAVERAFEISARKNPRVVTDAIYPVLGPIVRKSMSTALDKMVERTQLALTHAFSLQGWRWRVQAWLTGKSFADVVLLNSLVYRVEQVFLIHQETGLLLLHVQAAGAENESGDVKDADLVSGMLTAVQDFVRDSFKVKEGEALESVQVGDLTVWMERGPSAAIAAVIRGNAPSTLRTEMRTALEHCHLKYREALHTYSGDASPFEEMRPHLMGCLQAQYNEEKKASRGVLFVLIFLFLGLAGGLLGYRSWRDSQLERRWLGTVAALKAIPGIVVTEASRTKRRYAVRGLRDPDALDPRTVVAQHQIDPAQVDFDMAPYLSLDPPIIQRRVQTLLHPPDSVQLQFDGTALTARGSASSAWLRDARLLIRAIPGVRSFRDEVRELIPPPDLRIVLAQMTDELQKQHLSFFPLTANLKPNQEAVLTKIVELIKSTFELSAKTDERIIVQIIGYADQSPEGEAKNHLGQSRAQTLATLLSERGMDLTNIRTIGVGALTQELARVVGRQERPENWAVGFKVTAGE